jgi:DNA-binding GntR family transcriptional regulator
MSTLVVETRLAAFSSKRGYIVRKDITQSHHGIMAALQDWDSEAAADAIREHMVEAVDRLTGVLEERGVHVETVTEEPAPAGAYALGPITQPLTDLS